LPVAKRERHRRALVEAATAGEACFFSGTDSAPHVDAAKETACGCAGCFTAPVSLPVLAHVFEAAGALDRLEAFTSLNGAAFYGRAPNDGTLTLRRDETPVAAPARLATGAGPVTVFDPGFPLHWRIEGGA
jgi:dihydroorotase